MSFRNVTIYHGNFYDGYIVTTNNDVTKSHQSHVSYIKSIQSTIYINSYIRYTNIPKHIIITRIQHQVSYNTSSNLCTSMKNIINNNIQWFD